MTFVDKKPLFYWPEREVEICAESASLHDMHKIEGGPTHTGNQLLHICSNNDYFL